MLRDSCLAEISPGAINPPLSAQACSSIGTMHAAAAAVPLPICVAAAASPKPSLRYPEPSGTHGQPARAPCSLLSRKRVTQAATAPREAHDPCRIASRTRGAMMHRLTVCFPLGCNQTNHSQVRLQEQHQVESSSQQQEHGKAKDSHVCKK